MVSRINLKDPYFWSSRLVFRREDLLTASPLFLLKMLEDDRRSYDSTDYLSAMTLIHSFSLTAQSAVNLTAQVSYRRQRTSYEDNEMQHAFAGLSTTKKKSFCGCFRSPTRMLMYAKYARRKSIKEAERRNIHVYAIRLVDSLMKETWFRSTDAVSFKCCITSADFCSCTRTVIFLSKSISLGLLCLSWV